MKVDTNNPKVIWFTGLPGSGKTTLARILVQELRYRDINAVLLDGDEIRKKLSKDLGFTDADRQENIRRVAEVSMLFVENNMSTVNAFITPTEEIRKMIRSIIPEENLIEIYLDAPLQICEQRDPKGHYQEAREGKISNFTGIDSVFETPVTPDLVINTGELTIEESAQLLMEFLTGQP